MADTSRSSAQEAQEMFQLKKRALQYYMENGVPEKMEEILNSTFYDNPNDVYGHLANYFEGFQRSPNISKVVCREALDGKGQSTLQTEIHCMVKNFEKLMCTSLCCNESFPPDSMKQDDKDAAELERQKDIEKSLELINSTFSQNLRDLDPTDQLNVDSLLISSIEHLHQEELEKIAKELEEKGEDGDAEQSSARSPAPQESKTKAKSPKGKNKGPAVVIVAEEPREKYFCGSTSISALSKAVAETAACVKGVPLYKHLAVSRSDVVPDKMRLPIPMATIMMSGKLAPGKLNCVKEYMIIPRHDATYKQSVKQIADIYNYCAKNLSAKTGVIGKAVNDQGALWATFDRPEQGLDLLQEAITHLDLVPGQDFNIALNCAGHEIFDYDKGKYEVVTGLQKTADDLVDFWADIVNKYPAVIALIDPMRKQENEAWMRLCELISEKCYVMGDYVHHRPGLLKDEEVQRDFKTSGVILHMEHMTSITEIMAACRTMEGADNEIVMGTSVAETTDTFIVDLAIGSGARFIKLGAPCRGERIVKYNKLLQIEAVLEEAGGLAMYEDHVFPQIKPPTPAPEETDGEAAGDTETKSS